MDKGLRPRNAKKTTSILYSLNSLKCTFLVYVMFTFLCYEAQTIGKQLYQSLTLCSIFLSCAHLITDLL